MKLARINDMLGKNVFTKYALCMKTIPSDLGFNSASYSIVFMNGASLVKPFLPNIAFVRASFTPIRFILVFIHPSIEVKRSQNRMDDYWSITFSFYIKPR